MKGFVTHKNLEETSYSSSFYPDCATIIQEQLCKHFQSVHEWKRWLEEKRMKKKREKFIWQTFDVGEAFLCRYILFALARW